MVLDVLALVNDPVVSLVEVTWQHTSWPRFESCNLSILPMATLWVDLSYQSLGLDGGIPFPIKWYA
jgi:hypothetical protein